MLSSLLDVAGSDFRPLTNILDCSLLMKFGSFSSPMGQTCLPTLLAIFGLVRFYHTNYLIANLSLRIGTLFTWFFPIPVFVSFRFTSSRLYPLCPNLLFPRTPSSYSFLLSIFFNNPFDLQCLRRIHSVQSEPGPNSYPFRFLL